jgi:hypothetical protein
LLSRLIESGGSGVRVRRLGGNRAGEIKVTRFLRNPAVALEEMLSEAQGRLSARCAGRRVLAIQDTTVVRSSGGGGDYLHVVLAVDADDGAILGLIHADFLSRSSGRKQTRRARPIEEKESLRWLEGAAQASSVCSLAQSVTVIADRESDIYEAFARRPAGAHLLVRAAQDRALDDGGRLFATTDALPESARTELAVPAQPGRPARKATLAVRFMRTALARPKNGRRGEADASEVAVWAVDLREIDPPAGQKPLHWRLLTTTPVDDPSAALAVADLYRRRWAIEQLFRTMKTQGFDIEGICIDDSEPRNKLITAVLIAAVTVQQLVHARDGGQGPLRPMTDVFYADDWPILQAFCRKLEGKTAKQKNPHQEKSLAYAAWVCARLGGWTGYYGKPGPVVMLNGWNYLQAAKHGASLLFLGDV